MSYDAARCHMTLPYVYMTLQDDYMTLQDVKMTLQDVKMTLQSHILKAARILGCTAFYTVCSEPPAKRSPRIDENPFWGTALERTPGWNGQASMILSAWLTSQTPWYTAVTASLPDDLRHTFTRESSGFEYRGNIPRRRFEWGDWRFTSP